MPINFTRTVNPLQFDALEPKRFEDLVRQLLHDFRPWRQLEATGRSGSDDGFDARGWEVPDGSLADASSEEGEDAALAGARDRIWLVQCKRERAIGPTQLVRYLNAIAAEDVAQLHGILFVACADFSKRARDAFRKWCAEHGLAEFFLWGKAELEDALFQPKNDGLLFAYFGLSLTIRRRWEQARLRTQTTIKRKLTRALSDKFEVLLRDVADEDYPYRRAAQRDDFGWWVFRQPKLTFRGLECNVRRYFAYIDDDRKHWDYANVINDAQLRTDADPWRGINSREDNRQELWAFWSELPRGNQAWLDVWAVLPFDRILEVDELGDDITEHPHIYIMPYAGISRPFEYDYPELRFADGWSGGGSIEPTRNNRVAKFPARFRKAMPGDEVETEPSVPVTRHQGD
jgi:hypothetical protein